jgi:hypothetical protein
VFITCARRPHPTDNLANATSAQSPHRLGQFASPAGRRPGNDPRLIGEKKTALFAVDRDALDDAEKELKPLPLHAIYARAIVRSQVTGRDMARHEVLAGPPVRRTSGVAA